MGESSAMSRGSAASSETLRIDEAQGSITNGSEPHSISADEIALYDRQIRLWGMKAQEKLRTANILLVGLRALGNEIAKNLVLAGVGSLTIVDNGVVSEEDLGAQFFVRDYHVGQMRAEAALPEIQKLNPRVKLTATIVPILAQPPEYFAAFTLIIATDLPLSTLSTINAACRLSNRPFYCGGVHGLYGYIFADLITHDFVITREKSNVSTQLKAETPTRSIIAHTTKKENGKLLELVTKREIYSPLLLANSSPLPPHHLTSLRRKRAIPPLLSCLRALWEYQSLTARPYPDTASHDEIALFTTLATEKHKDLQLPAETLRSEFLRSFLQNLGAEIAPVTAFLGGQLAQDAINVIGGNEQPIQNFLCFDAEESKGPVFALHPISFDAWDDKAGHREGRDGVEGSADGGMAGGSGNGGASSPVHGLEPRGLPHRDAQNGADRAAVEGPNGTVEA